MDIMVFLVFSPANIFGFTVLTVLAGHSKVENAKHLKTLSCLPVLHRAEQYSLLLQQHDVLAGGGNAAAGHQALLLTSSGSNVM